MTENLDAAEKLKKERMKKVESILVSQAAPEDSKSPYYQLAEKYNVKVEFRPFIQIEPVSMKEFRKQKINILDHTAIILTSRNAVDRLFKICEELKVELPAEMKYFCVSEQTANYLQKYITIRKRKVFTGKKAAADLADLLKKHKKENFLYPCSDVRKDDIPKILTANNSKFTEAIIYKTVPSNLADLKLEFDMIAFFSPSGVSSLLTNFPEFKQDGMRIAAFGTTTAKAVKESQLILDVVAPLPNAPSMTGAIELYVKEANNLI
jgi:uroporphyrinogen-III synthase